jgi:hypothetical protein
MQYQSIFEQIQGFMNDRDSKVFYSSLDKFVRLIRRESLSLVNFVR